MDADLQLPLAGKNDKQEIREDEQKDPLDDDYDDGQGLHV